MRPMTYTEQEHQRAVENTVQSCVSALRLTRLAGTDENVAVALARLEDWLEENRGRWVK